MKRLIGYLAEVWAWFWQSKLLLQSIFIIACVLLYSYLTGPTEYSVMNGGYILQLLGMTMAIKGLLMVRRYFRHPPLADLARHWIEGFPRWRRSTIVEPAGAELSITGHRPYIEVWEPDRPDQPLEIRVEAILQNVERLREFQQATTQRLDDIDDHNRQRDRHHEDALAILANTLHSDLETLHTDDILQSLIGLVWVAAGIAISAWPSMIVRFLT